MRMDGFGERRHQACVAEGASVSERILQGLAQPGELSAVRSRTEVSVVRPVRSSQNMHDKTGQPLRVATLNVRGLAARRRQYQVSRLFLENELDLVAVQETKIESEEQTDCMVETFRTRYNVCICHAVGTSGGCAIFIRNNLGISDVRIVVSEAG